MSTKPKTKTRLKVVDSSKRQLDAMQILTVSSSLTNSRYDPRFAGMLIASELTHPGANFMIFGNTAFVMHDLENKGECYARWINADTASNAINNTIEFFKWLQAHGYYKVVTRFEDKNMVNVIKLLWAKYLKNMPNAGYNIGKLSHGGYQASIKLGVPTNG
jgi:hypothetical protein